MNTRRIVLMCLLAALAPSTARADITTDLVGHWRLDEGTGTAAADATGNGHTGTLTNSPTWVAGKIGPYAVSFGATNHWIALATRPTGSSFTISAWVNLTALSGDYKTIYADDNVGFWIHADTGKYDWYQGGSHLSTGAVSAGAWTHCAVTYTGGLITFYTNGVAAGTVSFTTNIPTSASTGIGGHNGNEGINGSLDDVRVYSRALTAADVRELYIHGQNTNLLADRIPASPTIDHVGGSIPGVP